MKSLFAFSMLVIVASCSKPQPSSADVEVLTDIKIDTTALDSFSPGATPHNMVPKPIVMDSLAPVTTPEKKSDEKATPKKEKEKQEAKEEIPETKPTTTVVIE